MSSSRINRGGRPIPGTFSTEFTPGQLVMGICVAFFVAVVCFGAGVLVGRNDPSLNQPPVAAAPAPTTPEITKPETTAKVETKTPPAPAPPPPRDTVPPLPPPQSPVTPGTPAASATTKKEAMPAPRSVELPPMDASKSSNRPPEVPVQLEKPPTPETVVKEEPPAKTDTKTAATNLPPLPEKGKTPAPETKPDTKSAAKATETKMAKSQNGLDDPLAEELLEPVSGAAKKTGAAKPAAAAAAPSAGGGQFGIQVGAFPGPNREAQANDMKKRVDAAGLKSEIRPSKDKQYYRVVIVGFKDRASAISALNGLKQRPGFEKSFVQDLSKI